MPQARITRSTVEKLDAIPGKQVKYFDTKMTGFGVRVSSQNTRTYFVQCRVKDRALPSGKPMEIYESIGRTDVVDFETAFNRAKQILFDAAHGITPDDHRIQRAKTEAEKQAAILEEAKKDITVREMFREYVETRKKLKESTIELYEEDFNRYIPDWMDCPLRSIDGAAIVQKHAEIGKLSPSRADGVMRVMRAVFNHALKMHEGVVQKNPVATLSAVNGWYKVERKQNYIRPEDLKKWVPAVLNLGHDTSQDFILMLLFHGTRLQETAQLRWSDINLEVGYAIFRETKTGVPLEVPLSRFIIERLQKRTTLYFDGPNSYIFPSHSQSGHVEGARSALESVRLATGIKVSHHDLRRSFISYCEELDISLFTRKRLANHALPQDVTEGYTIFSLEKLRTHVERIAEFILSHSGIPYQREEPPLVTADQAEMISKSAFWESLSKNQREAFLNMLRTKTTDPSVKE